MSPTTKNDSAWGKIFDTFPILKTVNQKGFFEISAKDINKFREARLMTKFDHHRQLPEIFKKNKLTIQPISRSSYVIGKFESYYKIQSLDFEEEIILLKENISLETIDANNLYSESSAVLCAYHTGIIQKFLGSDVDLTVLGRMSTGKFKYLIQSTDSLPSFEIDVENSQCEIDAGFEGNDFFAILEAKNTTVDDFLIRQLYYPYRLWSSKIRKKVIPVFMTYSNEVFSLYQYRFEQLTNYNSIKLVSQKKFQIIPNELELKDIHKILNSVKTIPEPKDIPFPQADNFLRVVDLLMQLKAESELSRERITTEYDFDVRQTQYYTNAARYLGLVKRDKNNEKGVYYTLSEKGVKISKLSPQKRNLALVQSILEHPVFNQALKLYFVKSKLPPKQEVADLMRKAPLNLDKDGSSTINRRTSTVTSWINWIMRLTNP